MKEISFDHVQFASASLVLAYDEDGVPFLDSDEDSTPRLLAGVTIFLEPKDPKAHYQQKELVPCQPTLIQVTSQRILLNQQEMGPNPQDLDQLTALLFEKIDFS